MRATRATTVLSSFLLSATLACGGGARDHREPPADTTAKPDVASSTTSPPAASPLGNLGPLSSMLADKLDAPGPYDPPRQSKDAHPPIVGVPSDQLQARHNLSAATPATTLAAPARRARPKPSFRMSVPMSAANSTEVSRSAETAASGARVIAHSTMP